VFVFVTDEKELSGKDILFKYVLINKYVWFLALAAVTKIFFIPLVDGNRCVVVLGASFT
jgi:hypothetical protein